jgi:DNA-binding YbaB/EbfC family protein
MFFKSLGTFASLLRNAHSLGSQMQELTSRLKAERVTGTAGGGLVEVEANGLGEVLRLRIDPALSEKADLEMVATLAPAAINQALEKARQLHGEALKSLAGQLELPSNFQDAISQLTGSPTDSPSSSK